VARPTLGQLLTRAEYGLRTGARVAWYRGQHMAMRRIADRVVADLPQRANKIKSSRPTPDSKRTLRAIAALFAADLGNVEAGIYPPPADEPGGLPAMVVRAGKFLNDVPQVARRQRLDKHQDIDPGAARSGLPRYFRQNFHFQTDGWLSEESAQIYDTQVETLFSGTAAAMRRQALVPLAGLVRRTDQRTLLHADIACGSGSFLRDVKRAFPRLNCIGVDLSTAYLKHCRQTLSSYGGALMVTGNAEALPLADGALDSASMIFLLHELPAKIRPVVLRELGRVLKSGAMAVIVDSLQTGDAPDFDGLLEVFPQLAHEPYFASYARTDFTPLFTRAGFRVADSWTAFMSKITVLERR
jgi:ubiquinone/menaquinone biosynthesis C-methylase UbiE